MAAVASMAFPLNGVTIASGADLSAYPLGTQNYLRKRGLLVGGLTFTAAKAFTGYAAAAPVLIGDFSAAVFRRLLGYGYVVGA